MPQYWQLPAVGGGPGAAPVPTGGALVYAERVPAEATAANGRTPGAAQLLQTASQRRFAAVATTATFAGVFALLCAVPAIVLLLTSVADVNFAGLKHATDTTDADNGRAQCLRVARRADYTIVFLGVGAPVQHLRLLLRVDEVVADTAEALYVFSSRLLKSQSIQCDSASAEATLVAHCYDVALVYDGAYEQRHVQTSFQFSNAEVAESRHARAYELRLDGELRLSLGHTVWLTTTHLCWAKHGAFPPVAGAADTVLPLARAYDAEAKAHWLSSAVANVAVFEPFADTPVAAAFHDADADCYQNEPENNVRVFPLAAYNEYAEWLVLGAQFAFEYSTDTLADRRTVIETGSECASLLAENSTRLARASAIYALDCGLQSYQYPCQTQPAVPYRRVADHKLRFDIDSDGVAIQLRAEQTRLLARLPRLLPFDESLLAALGRLLVLLITAAVVFVRGTERATDSMWLLSSVLDRIKAEVLDPTLLLAQKTLDVIFDAGITLAALAARVVVLAFAWHDLLASDHALVVAFEVTGVLASFVHFAIRYPPIMSLDLESGAPPVAKLGGPMGSVDVTAAVLLSFAETPLLATHDGRFAAVGRLLIALLIAVSVLPRCLFAATTCAMGASTVTNHPGYNARENGKRAGQQGYAALLTLAAVLWVLQGACSAGGLAALFVQPAAFSMTRMLRGPTGVIRYALLAGTLATGLPTITKTTLRALEHAQTEHDAAHGK